jgi:hypothetical protein
MNDRVLRSAISSKLTYSPPHITSRHNKPKNVTLDEYSKGAMVVSFRGTTNLRDLSDVLDLRMMDYAFCSNHVRVHAGMLRAFSQMENELTEKIMAARPTSLTFTGHSKGGSHAMFAAAYYKTMFDRRCHVTCHSFGALKTGDDAFVAWYNASVDDSLVLLNQHDIVGLHWPPVCTGYTGWANIKGCFVFDAHRSTPCADHAIDSYLEYISRSLK